MASASDNQIPEGSCVTAAKVPSKPYAGSKTTRIFLPTLRSSIRNIEGGKSESGIAFANQYNCDSKDKTVSVARHVAFGGLASFAWFAEYVF